MKCKCLILAVCFFLSLPFRLYGLTFEEERKYGKEIYLEIVRSTPIYYDPYISLYIDSIKKRLEDVANLPFPIVLTMIESKEVNAFATFGGYVYVTTGLIESCDKEEELAGVLGHEFAHIGKRHISKRLEKEKYINAGMIGAMLLSALVGAPQMKSAMLGTSMASAQTLSLKYSREDEDEADRVGTSFADKAGYSGLGIVEFFKKLRITGTDKMLPQYLLTHPYADERIKRIESTWTEKKEVTVDTRLFPYLSIRAALLQKQLKPGAQEIWLSRYVKDKNNPVNSYAASLIYMSKGDVNEALSIVMNIDSPFKNQFLGEILVDGRRFGEAINILGNELSPVSRFYLAKAYEGYSNLGMAIDILQELVPYGSAFPEILYRLGMISGRMGNQAKGFEYLGRYYVETGRYDLAKNNIEKAVAKYGINSNEAKELLSLLDQIRIKK